MDKSGDISARVKLNYYSFTTLAKICLAETNKQEKVRQPHFCVRGCETCQCIGQERTTVPRWKNHYFPPKLYVFIFHKLYGFIFHKLYVFIWIYHYFPSCMFLSRRQRWVSSFWKSDWESKTWVSNLNKWNFSWRDKIWSGPGGRFHFKLSF